MDKFPEYLVPEESKNFEEYYDKKLLSFIRQEIETIILLENENDYFDLVNFKEKHSIKDIKKVVSLCKVIQEELSKLGWKSKMIYADTALYIYNYKKPCVLNWTESETFS